MVMMMMRLVMVMLLELDGGNDCDEDDDVACGDVCTCAFDRLRRNRVQAVFRQSHCQGVKCHGRFYQRPSRVQSQRCDVCFGWRE